MNLHIIHTAPAAEADIDDIVRSLASQCLGMEVARIPEYSGPDGLLTASVTISGAWSGSVAVSCSSALARRAAGAMLGTTRMVSDEEARDALREIANIIGGNFKSLVSSPSFLSLPVFGDGADEVRPAQRVCFSVEGEPLLVSVLEGGGPEPTK